MDEKLSVIVPVYNAEKFLARCIKSLINQTYKNLEILLVNDGSKDDSLAICQKFAEQDNRIKVFDKPNGGASSARNLGIKHAEGEYIGFCDADDWIEPETYQTMIALLKEENAETVRFLSSAFDEKGKILERGKDNREIEVTPSREFLRKIFLRQGDVSLATRVFKASVVKKIVVPEGKRVEDFYFTICLYNNIEKDVLYNYPFYNYTLNSKSVTHSASGDIYFDALFFFNKAKEVLEEKWKNDFKIEQEYYILKLYYLIAISLNREEHKKYKQELINIKKDLRFKEKDINNNLYLSKKEKIVLKLACMSFQIPRLLYCLKNGR